jgi:hypothetical protein
MITGRLVDGNIELTAQQGTTWEYEIELYQDEANTIPFDLTGYFARGQYRKDRTPDAKLLISFDCEIPGVDPSTNPLFNKVYIMADAARSSALNNTELRINNLPVLRGVFDIEIYQMDAGKEINVMRPIEGTLIITPEVTR